MKSILWMGDSLKAMSAFPPDAKREAGYQLWAVQQGGDPSDWKPMSGIGAGVREIRIRTESAYRVVYVAKFEEAVYVLHAFIKKTQRTSKADIDLAARRYRDLLATIETK
jgi:phage-related protein